MEKYFNIGLPKWPALVVKGTPVTREQAMEIIIKTDGLYFCSNDREFEKDLYSLIYELDNVLIEREGLEKAIAKKIKPRRYVK